MTTIHHNPDDGPIRLIHFTPEHRPSWCWMFFRPVITLTGLQETIDGRTVDVGSGTTMSEHVPGTPSFPTRCMADIWAAHNGFSYDSAEIG